MIQANELRLGNLIKDISGNKIVVTIPVLIDVYYKPENYYPIPLYEAELLRYGFKYLGEFKTSEFETYKRFYLSDDCEVHYIKSNYGGIGTETFAYAEGGSLDYRTNFRFISVHQLQNIYFILKGEELKIK